MTKMMKALVKAKAEKGLWLQDVPVQEIAPDEVRIKIYLLYTSPSPRD